MKVQEAILRATAKEITRWRAAGIIGISDRSMRRWRQRYEEHGYDGLLHRRRGKPSPKRVPLKVAEEVLQLYREKYPDLNVRHFHEKLRERYVVEMNGKFAVPAGHAFVPTGSQDLKLIFCVQTQRTVDNDNTVAMGERVRQIERTPWRGTLDAG
jgi:transposase